MTEKQSETDYKDKDDLGLYDSVVENLFIDHKSKTITFTLLKVMDRIDKSQNSFTYKVRRGTLIFDRVVFANLSYGLYFDEWSEFYRSAEMKTSKLLSDYCKHLPSSIKIDNLKHYYLGIDNGTDYKEFDIICDSYSLTLENEEKILHDDFDWLY
jgi:hypothetical protein